MKRDANQAEDLPSSANLATYGLRIAGLAGARRLLGHAAPDWPVLQVERRIGIAEVDQVVTDEWADFRLQGDAGSVHLDRATLTAQFDLCRPIDDEATVHPFLAMTAGIVSRWLGRDAFHAGAFVVDDGAWAVLGQKGTGKSTTLGFLAVNATTIVTDDVLVLDSGDAMAGPSCVDLRPDAAEFLDAGEDLGVVGARSRFRVVVPTAPPRTPLRGWVFPTWSDTLELVPVPVSQRLSLLAANLALRRAPLHPDRFLDFAALPCWELRRPQRFDMLPEVAALLLDRLAG
ncbi:MAG TPA: hypothetical protein VM282_05405 [Acidimicrobiales bacterium]|nr:hypothetical protein [Acidimicrobiales bacterium]